MGIRESRNRFNLIKNSTGSEEDLEDIELDSPTFLPPNLCSPSRDIESVSQCLYHSFAALNFLNIVGCKDVVASHESCNNENYLSHGDCVDQVADLNVGLLFLRIRGEEWFRSENEH